MRNECRRTLFWRLFHAGVRADGYPCTRDRGIQMLNLLLMMAVFAATFIVGYLLISKVPALLHTPLMSMTNAISAVTILGAIILFSFPTTAVEKIFGGVAIVTATFNVVGGFAITDRMLKLFKEKQIKEKKI
jgi:NAD(P) transhydrogenase subunit alpha